MHRDSRTPRQTRGFDSGRSPAVDVAVVINNRSWCECQIRVIYDREREKWEMAMMVLSWVEFIWCKSDKGALKAACHVMGVFLDGIIPTVWFIHSIFLFFWFWVVLIILGWMQWIDIFFRIRLRLDENFTNPDQVLNCSYDEWFSEKLDYHNNIFWINLIYVISVDKN